MRPDWDADSPELRQNLTGLLQAIEQDARPRKPPTVETARRAEPNADQTKVIVEVCVCAWARAEWVPDLEPVFGF